MASLGGRRWVVVFWLDHDEAGPNLDRLRLACAGGVCAQVFDRDQEYRFVWDADRSMWRMDRRSHVAGG
jgi:hypothetical protein